MGAGGESCVAGSSSTSWPLHRGCRAVECANRSPAGH